MPRGAVPARIVIPQVHATLTTRQTSAIDLAGKQDIRAAVPVQFQINHPRDVIRSSLENFAEFPSGDFCLGRRAQRADGRSVGLVYGTVPQISVIQAVVKIAWMIFRGDE